MQNRHREMVWPDISSSNTPLISYKTYPKVKQMEKAMPTRARDLDLVADVVTSLMIAL